MSDLTDDPFGGTHTDSDEDYTPIMTSNRKSNLKYTFSESSSESAGDSVEGTNEPEASQSAPQLGRKRLQRKALWKRNIRKLKRTEGKSYLNMAGSVVTGKTQGENCNCPKKCFDKIGEDVGLIFSEFYKLPSKNLQDSYLYGLMKRKHVERTRPRSGSRQPKVSSYVYAVRHNGQEVTVCKKAFQNLHGITKSRLERLQQHLSLGNATPPIDRRGFHQHRANKLPADTITQVREHILSFPRYKSHYSRKDNLQHFYLSPLLSIAKMHELYLEKHEPDQYALLLQNQKIKPIVKYEYFRKYFTENYKINFGKPKSDTCSKCDKLMNKINSADSVRLKDLLK
nr:unnamed protein product [Callosobruchus chinensis]